MERINRLRKRQSHPLLVGRSLSTPVEVYGKEGNEDPHNYHWHYHVKTKRSFFRRPFFGKRLLRWKSQSISRLNAKGSPREHLNCSNPSQHMPDFIYRSVGVRHETDHWGKSYEINETTASIGDRVRRVTFERSSSEPSGPTSWRSQYRHLSMKRIHSVDSGQSGFLNNGLIAFISSGLSRIISSNRDVPASIEEEEGKKITFGRAEPTNSL